MTKNICITLLTWNDWSNTIECLESIFQNDYKNFDVILINNGSNSYNIQQWCGNLFSSKTNESIFNNNTNSYNKRDKYTILCKTT